MCHQLSASTTSIHQTNPFLRQKIPLLCQKIPFLRSDLASSTCVSVATASMICGKIIRLSFCCLKSSVSLILYTLYTYNYLYYNRCYYCCSCTTTTTTTAFKIKKILHFTQTWVCCVGANANPLLGALSQRRLNLIKLAYKLARWPAPLSASTFNQIGKYASHGTAYCYAELAAFSIAVAMMIATAYFAYPWKDDQSELACVA